MATLEAERKLAVTVGVKAHSDLLQVGDHAGGVVDEDLSRRAPHQSAAGELSIGQVQLRRVVVAERRRQAALRPVAGSLCKRRGADHDHACPKRRGG